MKKTLLIDTDLGADCDDAIALALALNAAKEGRILLPAITISSTRKHAPNVLSAILDYYGFDAEIGQMSLPGLECDGFDHYAYAFAGYPAHPTMDAVELLRKSIAEHPGITLVTIGPLTNLARLLETNGDRYSPLSGKELIEQNVSALYLMGCSFQGKQIEWNIAQDAKAAQAVFLSLPIPLYAVPGEVGEAIQTGLSTKEDENSPIWRCLQEFGSFIPNHGDLSSFTRESWDPLTVLSAMEAPGLRVVSSGTIRIGSHGESHLLAGEGNHHIIGFADEGAKEKLRALIEANIRKKR